MTATMTRTICLWGSRTSTPSPAAQAPPGPGQPMAHLPRPRGTQPLLVGRGRELALLTQHLTGSVGEIAPPPVLLLAGVPGIGKTCLLQEAAALGRRDG